MSQLTNWQINLGGTVLQGAIQFQDEGVDLGGPGQATTVDFVGAGVTAAIVGQTLTVTIPGGGGGPNVISSPVTLNVPGDYPTLDAAISYAISSVVLEDAIVTIEVEDTETISQQVILTGTSAPWLKIVGLGAGPTVDGATFAANLFGARPFISLENSTLGQVSGVWRGVNTNLVQFVFALSSAFNTGSLVDTLDITNFGGQGFFVVSSKAGIYNTQVIPTGNDAISAYYDSVVTVFGGGLDGRITAIGATVDFINASITATDEALDGSGGATFNFSGNCNVTGWIKLDNSTLRGVISNWSEPGSAPSFLLDNNGGNVNLNVANVTLVGGSGVGLCRSANGGYTGIDVSNVTSSSGGRYATVQQSGQINVNGSTGLGALGAFTGGASQVPNVITENGMIISPFPGGTALAIINGTGAGSLIAGRGISSVVKTGTGLYTVNFATPMPNTDYVVNATSGNSTGGDGVVRVPTRATTHFDIVCLDQGGTVLFDSNYIAVRVEGV